MEYPGFSMSNGDFMEGGGKCPTSIFEILPWGANSGILKGWVGPSGEIPKYSRNIPEPEKSET